MFEAARLTDSIAHTSALTGFLVGALIGIALIAAVAFATVTCGCGLALVAGLLAGIAAGAAAPLLAGLGESIGKMFTSPSGTITSGSPNVFVNNLAAAHATRSTTICSKHNPLPLVAEGSSNVFINGLPAARKKDSITCGAKIDDGSSNVFIGGGTVAYLPIEDEVPAELREKAEVAFMLAGLLGGVGGLIKGAGGLSRAILPCLGKFVAGSVIGEAVGRYVITPVVTRVMGGILGRPVDVATGRKVLLTQDEIDFVMQSQIPLIVSRFYGSNLRHESTLGTGWVLPWDLRLQQRDGKIWFADGEGRETGFPLVQPGHAVFSDVEQCYLACTTDGQFILYDLNEMYYDFGHLDLGSNDIAWVRRVENRTGQWHAYQRDEFDRVQTIRTSGDQQLRLHYTDAPSRLIQVECEFGGTPGSLASYGYDSLGQLSSVTDANGNIVRQFTYTDGVMESHTGALGFKCSYRWATVDGQPRVVSCSTSAGEQTSFSYDTATRQTWAKDEQGREAHWTYDEYFQIIACTDFDNGQYHVAYTTAGMPSLIQLPGDREIAFEYDDAARIIRDIDPLGRITQTSYDGNSLRISLLTLPDGRQWRAEYDYFGRTKSTIDPLNRRESYEYGNDLNPLPLAKIDARGGRKLMKWNLRGLLTAYTDCSGKSTFYEYDIDGQLAATTNALGQTTRYKRLRTGEPVQVILPDGSAEIFKYDPAGLIVEQQNSAAQSRSWTRNERGQVVHAIDPAQRHLHYRYDVRGRLVELVCDSDTRYSFEYDIGDRVAREINPDGIERRLRYDVAGELLEMEKIGYFSAKGPYAERVRRTTSFARDQLGRLLAQATATATTRYMWDDADQLLEARTIPTEIGTELGIKASEVRFEYDKGGRLVTELGSEGAVSYAFDELNNLTTLALPNNQRIDTLTYGSGHVHQIHSGGHVISDFERDGLHREVQHTQGTLTQRVGYDQLGRRTWQSAGATPELLGPGQGRLWRSYRYQATGELAEQRDNLRGEINFRYNLSGQLHQHTRAAEQVQEQFRWDAVGNLLDDSGRKSSGQLEGNRLKVWQDIRFEYDAWGNVSTKRKGAHQTQHFTFDADDRLLKVTTENLRGLTETCFDYDPFGRRIGSTETRLETLGAERIERKRFVWQGLRMIQEVRESSVSSYVYSPDAEYTPLARLDASIIAADVIENAKNSTRVYHFHTDLVGAPLEVTDEAGELAWAGKYRAWGKVEGGEDQALLARIEQPLRFPGQYADESTGLHYNTFRFYDPDIGRFISQDPIGLDGGANLYAYTPNPTGWMDPWGWCAKALGKNMEAAGIHRPPNTTPHHIAGDTSIRSLPARNILKAHGIHHDDALNGVFLPNRGNTDLSIPGILHNGRHPDKYIDAVNDRLRTANAKGGKQAVEMELGKLRQELLNAVRTAKWSTVI